MTTRGLLAVFEEECARQPPEIAVVLGSGLGQIARRVLPVYFVKFSDIPDLPATSVAGHLGRMTLGEWAGKNVLLFEGRLHRYEGHSWEVVERCVRLAAALGVRGLLLTNAAGGIGEDLTPGRLMAVRDHMECNRPNWWRHPGPGDRPSPYSPRMLAALREAAVAVELPLAEGNLAAVTGPCYETPAEIRALRAWGADAVGMSTAREARIAAELGMEVAALSLITNGAAGLSPGPVNHEEVLAHARAGAGRLADLLEAFLHRWQ